MIIITLGNVGDGGDDKDVDGRGLPWSITTLEPGVKGGEREKVGKGDAGVPGGPGGQDGPGGAEGPD